ncbi:proprotein convertase P-domain-containing protein [Nannocystis pusilla]|uniref:proprotein convertase P-domain-containing protein n=1 Tax=Nannocystis pusilla TaxID=889268 RepID=UPI003B7F2191
MRQFKVTPTEGFAIERMGPLTRRRSRATPSPTPGPPRRRARRGPGLGRPDCAAGQRHHQARQRRQPQPPQQHEQDQRRDRQRPHGRGQGQGHAAAQDVRQRARLRDELRPELTELLRAVGYDAPAQLRPRQADLRGLHRGRQHPQARDAARSRAGDRPAFHDRPRLARRRHLVLRLDLPAHFSDLRIALESPSGQELLLWDENDVPSPDYYSEEITTHYGYELPIGVLHIDDLLTPSPLGTELGALVGEAGNGIWKLKLSSPGTAALLVNWRLNFFGTPTP